MHSLNPMTLREGIPALSHARYLNTGTFGHQPQVVTHAILEAYRLVGRHGGFSPLVRDQIEQVGFEQTRSTVADVLHVTADEIALTRNTSDGICTIAYGLDWRPGDQVIITDQEHSSGGPSVVFPEPTLWRAGVDCAPGC